MQHDVSRIIHQFASRLSDVQDWGIGCTAACPVCGQLLWFEQVGDRVSARCEGACTEAAVFDAIAWAGPAGACYGLPADEWHAANGAQPKGAPLTSMGPDAIPSRDDEDGGADGVTASAEGTDLRADDPPINDFDVNAKSSPQPPTGKQADEQSPEQDKSQWLAKLAEFPDRPVLIVDCAISAMTERLAGKYLVVPTDFVLAGSEEKEDAHKVPYSYASVNRRAAEALSGLPPQCRCHPSLGQPGQRNRELKLWCRNDLEGFQRAAAIARGIESAQGAMGPHIFNSVYIVIPHDDWTEGADANDLIASGWTAEQLLGRLTTRHLVDELEVCARRRYGARWNEKSLRGSQREFEGEGCHLSEQHFLLIKNSAISPEVSRERKYRTITTKAELERKGFGASQRMVPTLLIPLYRADGSFAETYQHRPDQPRINKKTHKPVKYETPANSHMVLDVPPALSRKRIIQIDAPYFDTTERPSLIADRNVPLWITEGVRKDDAGVSIGLCCVALLGVWNWRGSNDAGGVVALPDWENVALKGRTVYLAFDNDVMVKRPVYQALKRLKAFLESRGATLKIIYLPAGAHAEKIGLDDFIAAKKLLGESDERIRAALLELAAGELQPPPDSDEEGFRQRVGEYAETDDDEVVRITTDRHGNEARDPLMNFTVHYCGYHARRRRRDRALLRARGETRRALAQIQYPGDEVRLDALAG